MTTLTWDRHRGHASSYDVATVGLNYRLDEIRAAMARVQLKRLPAANRQRAQLADRYVELLHGRLGMVMPFAEADRSAAAHHLAVVVLTPGVDREEVRASLTAAGVQTSVHYPPVHRFTAYADTPSRPLPRTEQLETRILTLPLFPTMTDEQQQLVADQLLAAVARAGAVETALVPEEAA